MRYPVIFLPGIIAPAAIRYGPLVERLGDVEVVVRDLAVYDDHEPPPDFSIDTELVALDRAADDGAFESSTSMGTRAAVRSRSPTRQHMGIAFRVWRWTSRRQT
jgi:hypothetical protein